LDFDRANARGDRPLRQVAVTNHLVAALGVVQLGPLLDPFDHFILNCLG
jgi:hypothetical protein